ncbi:glycosyltransferase family 39 protein, partial [bacterium]|nr:glycosyltransferase family 39 protein [bacterium]
MVRKKELFYIFFVFTALSVLRCFYCANNILGFILSFIFLSFSLICPGIFLYRFFSSKSKKINVGVFSVSILILGTAWNSFIILVLSCFFKFSLPTLLVINSLLISTLFFISFRKKIFITPPDKLDYFALIFIVIAVFLFFRPMPRINGGRDPGVYFGTAMNIANHRTLIFKEHSIPEFSKKFYDNNLLYNYDRSGGTGMYLPGFYLIDHKEGKIAPQFFHLYSSFIALPFALFGIKFALYSTCFLAWLSVLAIYYCVKNIFGGKTALFSIIIFIFSVHNVWYARYPNSEIMVQLFFFASIFFFSQSQNFRQYLLSGLILGLTFFARIDSLLLVGSLMVTAFLPTVKPRLIKSAGIFIITALI